MGRFPTGEPKLDESGAPVQSEVHGILSRLAAPLSELPLHILRFEGTWRQAPGMMTDGRRRPQ